MDKESNFPILLISDLDDTIKISHTQSKLVTIYRGLFRSSAFAGMATLYHELLGAHPNSKFVIISSSPPTIRRKIEFFLSLNGFPAAELILRDWFRESSVKGYKLRSIVRAVEAATLPVILVGDDTEHDPEAMAEAARRFPERVAARYCRVVKGRELPPGTIGFFTAFDIACSELAAGRLSNSQVLHIGEMVLSAEKHNRLIPWFSLKPPLHFVPFLISPDEAIVELWKKIQSRLEAIPKRKTKS